MSGCRSLTNDEIQSVLMHLGATRNHALFLLGIKSGFRVSELLSLKVCDVMQYGKIIDRVTVSRKFMKGQKQSRTVALHRDAKFILEQLIKVDQLDQGSYLFRSRKGENKPITRIQAWKVLTKAFALAKISGKVATHTMRKTFASRVYDKLGRDLVKTQHALGHSNISSTIKYLSFRQEEIDEAILSA
jgi:integrase